MNINIGYNKKSNTFGPCVHAGASSYTGAHFGQGVGPIQLNYIWCIGNESRLLDCPHTTIHDCTHSEDAGVACPGKSIIS